ncbi:MAG: hypothetical protein ABIK99_06030 [candidate division WOR-3 bacterium]
MKKSKEMIKELAFWGVINKEGQLSDWVLIPALIRDYGGIIG